jgi:hypothetical protein
MCLKNSKPKPKPWLAPSIKPGRSATTKLLPSGTPTTPKLGFNVVKCYAAILGLELLIAAINVDLPTEG